MIDEIGGEIVNSGRTAHEIVTMASLIEEEAITDAERPIIAGILWKRFDDRRGLGVDATVRYILEKPTAVITSGDLNGFRLQHSQVPWTPGPIASPGPKSDSGCGHTASFTGITCTTSKARSTTRKVTSSKTLNRIQYLGKGCRRNDRGWSTRSRSS